MSRQSITEIDAKARFGDWHATCCFTASAGAAMRLPFTKDQFFDVFAAHNGVVAIRYHEGHQRRTVHMPARIGSLTLALATLMLAQSVLGLLMPTQYRDADWIKAAWFGNDLMTLVIAVPLIIAGQRATFRSLRAELLWIGALGYAVYNYTFYLFGAALNAFLPLYVITLGLAIVTLASALSRLDPNAVKARFHEKAPTRVVGAYLVSLASALAIVWIAIWAAYVFAGRPTPVAPEAFKIVAAVDLLWLVPSLAAGGVLLWMRRPWGYVIGPAAAVQGALYLSVLSLNSIVAIACGLANAPGELPIWAPLTVFTSIAALLLLRHTSENRIRPWRR